MGRWAQARRRSRVKPPSLSNFVLVGTLLSTAGSGTVDAQWAVDVNPDDVNYILKKTSDGSTLQTHTDHLPGTNAGDFVFSGVTVGFVVFVEFTFLKAGYNPLTVVSANFTVV